MSVFKILALVIIFGLGIFLLVQAFKPNKPKKVDNNSRGNGPSKNGNGGNGPVDDEDDESKVDWGKIKLKDIQDKQYELPSNENTVLINSKRAVNNNANAPVLVRMRISVTSDWYNSIDQLVRDAHTVFKNANSPQYPTRAENFLYYRQLYYRSVKAGQLLHDAENRVQQKLNSLHAIQFDNTFSKADRRTIIDLQNSLKAFKDVIHNEKIGVWNNTHNLKGLIRRCGNRGKTWYEINKKHHIENFGK
jgi:hypothetical protein